MHTKLFAPSLLDYISSHTSAPSPLLGQLERETHLKTLYPRMLSGHVQGRFLAFLSKLICPVRILEIGTFTGYSCICLAEGLAEKGIITTIEMDEELKFMIEPYLEAAGIRHKVDLRFGRALEVLEQMSDNFDMVFIDADKQNYLSYYHKIFPMVNSGGVILADNVLWSGKVWDGEARDKETVAIKEFNDYVINDSKVESMLMPLRDGMMVVRKR